MKLKIFFSNLALVFSWCPRWLIKIAFVSSLFPLLLRSIKMSTYQYNHWGRVWAQKIILKPVGTVKKYQNILSDRQQHVWRRNLVKWCRRVLSIEFFLELFSCSWNPMNSILVMHFNHNIFLSVRPEHGCGYEVNLRFPKWHSQHWKLDIAHACLLSNWDWLTKLCNTLEHITKASSIIYI